MQILKTSKELLEFRQNLEGGIGFVPTMGALHDGHKSLIKKAVLENENAIVSVFLNPKQFAPNEDLDTYPRKDEDDIKICEDLGVKAVFLPNADEFYSQDETTIKANPRLASMLEGATRPTHFDGVCTVLNKLFHLVRPNKAYFGKKDTQQIFVVKNMVEDFFLPIEIVPCEIVRAKDGLALSSRNAYLKDEEFCEAIKLSRSLNKAKNLIENGELKKENLFKEMMSCLEPVKIDYIALVNRNFEAIDVVEPGNSIILIAAYVGKTRLIDNLWI